MQSDQHYGFDYDAVDAPDTDDIEIVGAVAKMFNWIMEPRSHRAKIIRMQAVRYYLPECSRGRTQVQMAREVGTTKANLGKVLTMFRAKFNGVSAPGMRGDKLRKKLSYICKIRKQLK